MFSGTISTIMLITGILLTPTIHADAATDLTGLKTIVNSAATVIGAPTNSSWNWGSFSSDSGSMVSSFRLLQMQ
jgi:hypothetical protein